MSNSWTWTCYCHNFLISSQFHRLVSQTALENSSPVSLFWEWSSLTSRQTQVIMFLLWHLAKWLPFFRSASELNSFTVKSSKKHQSRERPPAYIITVASGSVSPILSQSCHQNTCHWERPLIDYESWGAAPCGYFYQLSDCNHSHLKFYAVYEWEWDCVCVLISTFQ